ncbi:Protein FAR-RED IMPAIRED RESPONSE 1, partial [Bienertia sinuspersici]
KCLSGYKAKDKTRKPDQRRKINGKRCVIDSQIENDLGVKTSKKYECPVMIYASVNAENEWVVLKVVKEHQNHNPTPSKFRFIAAHCKEEMNCHVKSKQNMLARERNGLQEMAINASDIRNELYREKKLKLKDGDAKAMLEYSEKMIEDNQIFFHTYRLDNFCQMQEILLVDSHSRVTYEEFNDVMCQSPWSDNPTWMCQISHETTMTFEWVTRPWVDWMRRITPGGI